MKTARYALMGLPISAAVWILVALWDGYDFDWDVLNYHYYNGFALLHHRTFVNLQPAMLQTYFAPFMDGAFYAMVLAFPPTIVVALIAGFQSVGFAFLFSIGHKLLADSVAAARSRAFAALVLTVLGAAAPVSIWEAGSPRGDTITAVLVLAALLLVIDGVFKWGAALPPGRAALAGVLTGLATALKLTSAAFALGVLAALFVTFPARESAAARYRWMGGIVAHVGGMIAGFAFLYGWWGWALWQHLGNPLFPNFNQIFHSPYAEYVSYADPAFLLPTWHAKLLFPFIRNPMFGGLDAAGLFDVRIAVTLPLCILALLAALMRNAAATQREWRALAASQALLVFVVVGYVGWLLAFPINRYLVAVDLVAPLACAVALLAIWRTRWTVWVAIGCMAIALPASAWHGRSLFWLPGDHRHGDSGGYFGVKFDPPAAIGSGVVAMLGDRPTTFVIPFFPVKTVFLRLQGSLQYPNPNFYGLNTASTSSQRRSVFGNAMGAAICRRLDNADGDLYLLRLSSPDTPHDQAALQYFGLKETPGSCELIPNRSNMELALCKALRTATPECRSGSFAVR